MSFLTKVITDTSPDFGDNPQIVTENGQPSSVDVENLVPNTGYWTKAEIWQNGVLNDTSEVEDFQTLPAGTITLTHQSSVRSGSNYIVTYTYTSTYALSSSVLTCGVSISSQGVIAGNTITFTVSGLVPGDAYISQITTIDMYGESAQTSITLIMPVVNEVSITGTTTTSSTVVCELDYIIDGGFYQGFIEYWDENDDPSTDQPLGHASFANGADTCTVSGLTDGTTYKFRARIEYNNGSNSVVSSVVTATTVTDYSTKYFTISGCNYIDITASNGALPSDYQPIYYSIDNGSTWNSLTPQTTAQSIRPAQTDGDILLKHAGAVSTVSTKVKIQLHTLTSTAKLSGNIASLCFGDNFTGTKTMPDYAYSLLFAGNSTISAHPVYINAQNISFSSYTSVSNYGMYCLFQSCEYLTSLPDFSCITSVGDYGMCETFGGCTSLTTPPDFSNVTSVGNHGMSGVLQLCTSLTTPPDLSSVTTIGDYGMYCLLTNCSSLTTPPDVTGITTLSPYGFASMLRQCSSLTIPPDLSNITSVETYGMANMFRGCTSLTTPPDLSNVITNRANGMEAMFHSCSSLTTPPDLRGIRSVSTNGFNAMFKNCSSLTTSPNLSGITFVNSYGLRQMFYGCTSLKTIYAPTISWDTRVSSDWVYNVSASGTLYADASIINSIPTNSKDGCPSGWTKEFLN